MEHNSCLSVNTKELSRTCLKVSAKLEFASVCFLEVLKNGVTAEKPLRVRVRTRGPFLESPVHFSGPKSNIQIEIQRIRARVLAGKLLHFVSLTDSFIMLDAKLLKPRSLMETETAYRAR